MSQWPKTRPELTPRQIEAMEDWYVEFLGNIMPGKYGWYERFNHEYAARSQRPGARTLEIGAGNGAHLQFEDVAAQKEYIAVELRDTLGSEIKAKYPNVSVSVGDVQAGLDFPDDHFDRVLAIHMLEHLDNLPLALREVRRVLKPGGDFSVVIPCEGGKVYALGRRLSVAPKFEKRYNMPYNWMMEYEHINNAWEVLDELGEHFTVKQRQYFPFRVPSVEANIAIGLTLTPRA